MNQKIELRQSLVKLCNKQPNLSINRPDGTKSDEIGVIDDLWPVTSSQSGEVIAYGFAFTRLNGTGWVQTDISNIEDRVGSYFLDNGFGWTALVEPFGSKESGYGASAEGVTGRDVGLLPCRFLRRRNSTSA